MREKLWRNSHSLFFPMLADLFWTAPEVLRTILQHDNVVPTKEADIFSLGVVLKQLLCKNFAYNEELAHQTPKGVVATSRHFYCGIRFLLNIFYNFILLLTISFSEMSPQLSKRGNNNTEENTGVLSSQGLKIHFVKHICVFISIFSMLCLK